MALDAASGREKDNKTAFTINASSLVTRKADVERRVTSSRDNEKGSKGNRLIVDIEENEDTREKRTREKQVIPCLENTFKLSRHNALESEEGIALSRKEEAAPTELDEDGNSLLHKIDGDVNDEGVRKRVPGYIPEKRKLVEAADTGDFESKWDVVESELAQERDKSRSLAKQVGLDPKSGDNASQNDTGKRADDGVVYGLTVMKKPSSIVDKLLK